MMRSLHAGYVWHAVYMLAMYDTQSTCWLCMTRSLHAGYVWYAVYHYNSAGYIGYSAVGQESNNIA